MNGNPGPRGPRHLSPGLRAFLRREAQEGSTNRDEYADRHGIEEFESTLRRGGTSFDPHEAIGAQSVFLVPTDEETRPWGNTAALTFNSTFAGIIPFPAQLPSTQLIHMARHRPTTV